MPTGVTPTGACDACHADAHYTEHGRAWIGGLAAGLTALVCGIPFAEISASMCPKHRESFDNFFKQLARTE